MTHYLRGLLGPLVEPGTELLGLVSESGGSLRFSEIAKRINYIKIYVMIAKNSLLLPVAGVFGNRSVFTGTSPLAAAAATADSGKLLAESCGCIPLDDLPGGGMSDAPSEPTPDALPYGELASSEESDTPTCGSQWFRRMLSASSRLSSMRVPCGTIK